jgi:hypothetical protein
MCGWVYIFIYDTASYTSLTDSCKNCEPNILNLLKGVRFYLKPT